MPCGYCGDQKRFEPAWAPGAVEDAPTVYADCGPFASILCVETGGAHFEFDINFCPICGRALLED